MGNTIESCKEDVKNMKILLNRYDAKIKICIDCHTLNEVINMKKSFEPHINDLLIIFYAGHGKMLGKKINNKMEIISTWVNNDNSLTHSDKIDNILSLINCNKILISDSCHSGNFSNFYKGDSPFLFIGSSSIVSLSNEYIIFHNKKTGVLVSLFEYLLVEKSFSDLTLSDFTKKTITFFNHNKIKVKPIVKIYNI